jgi:hypothetical protein
MHREDRNTQFFQHDRAVLSKPTQSANQNRLCAAGSWESFTSPSP